MKEDALQQGLPVPDEAATRERVLRKNVEFPDLATLKDFFRFNAAAGKGYDPEKKNNRYGARSLFIAYNDFMPEDRSIYDIDGPRYHILDPFTYLRNTAIEILIRPSSTTTPDSSRKITDMPGRARTAKALKNEVEEKMREIWASCSVRWNCSLSFGWGCWMLPTQTGALASWYIVVRPDVECGAAGLGGKGAVTTSEDFGFDEVVFDVNYLGA